MCGECPRKPCEKIPSNHTVEHMAVLRLCRCAGFRSRNMLHEQRQSERRSRTRIAVHSLKITVYRPTYFQIRIYFRKDILSVKFRQNTANGYEKRPCFDYRTGNLRDKVSERIAAVMQFDDLYQKRFVPRLFRVLSIERVIRNNDANILCMRIRSCLSKKNTGSLMISALYDYPKRFRKKCIASGISHSVAHFSQVGADSNTMFNRTSVQSSYETKVLFIQISFDIDAISVFRQQCASRTCRLGTHRSAYIQSRPSNIRVPEEPIFPPRFAPIQGALSTGSTQTQRNFQEKEARMAGQCAK